jgi:hypothetical protein
MRKSYYSQDEEKISPDSSGIRNFCRVAGPISLGIAGILIATAIINFTIAFGGTKPPTLFWCFPLAFPFLIAGAIMTNFGYMGKIARYHASQMAPVAKDTFNYMADGTADGIKTMASAIGEGLSEGGINLGGSAEPMIKCHKCNETVDADSKFCSGCGAPMGKTKPCPRCDELNDPDAKFCDDCGTRFY